MAILVLPAKVDLVFRLAVAMLVLPATQVSAASQILALALATLVSQALTALERLALATLLSLAGFREQPPSFSRDLKAADSLKFS